MSNISDMLNTLKGMILDGHNDTISSKRIITVGCFVLLVVAFFANMKFGYKIADNIMDTIKFTLMAGLGMTGVEKFAPKLPAPNSTPTTPTTEK